MASYSDGIFSNTMGFIVPFKNFPEWAIPFVKVIPKIKLTSGYTLSSVTSNIGCRHWWYLNTNDDKTESYFLYVEVNCITTQQDGKLLIPSYVDLDLVIQNEQIFEELNPFKS